MLTRFVCSNTEHYQIVVANKIIVYLNKGAGNQLIFHMVSKIEFRTNKMFMLHFEFATLLFAN